MKIRLASPLQMDSIVDGAGIRTVIWTQGCGHACKGCHNPETHDFNSGQLFDVEEIKKQIDELLDQDGITFSGGDPMYQPEACNELAKHIQKKGLNVWCYTGFTYEQLLKKAEIEPIYLEFLNNIDVLIDGPFVFNKKSLSVMFRGSTNQRIIDVKKSLKNNRVEIISKYDKHNELKEKECIFI